MPRRRRVNPQRGRAAKARGPGGTAARAPSVRRSYQKPGRRSSVGAYRQGRSTARPASRIGAYRQAPASRWDPRNIPALRARFIRNRDYGMRNPYSRHASASMVPSRAGTGMTPGVSQAENRADTSAWRQRMRGRQYRFPGGMPRHPIHGGRIN